MRSQISIVILTSVALSAAAAPASAQSAEETAAFLFGGMSDTGSEPGNLRMARNLERISDEPLTFRQKIDIGDSRGY